MTTIESERRTALAYLRAAWIETYLSRDCPERTNRLVAINNKLRVYRTQGEEDEKA
jgi:hypothetical protein